MAEAGGGGSSRPPASPATPDLDSVEGVHRDAVLLLSRMDALGLSHPAAYLSLAIGTLAKEHPQLPTTPSPEFHHC